MSNFRNSRNRRVSSASHATTSVQTTASVPLAVGASSLRSLTDLVLPRVAHMSQFALVVLAFVGYVFTVLPVYQKSLLDEDIAKKTLELRVMEGNISKKEALLASKSSELTNMSERFNQLRGDVNTTRQGLGQAKAEVEKLRGVVDFQYSSLRYWNMRSIREDTLQTCKMSSSKDAGFAECLLKRVLDDSSLKQILSPDDLTRLQRIVKSKIPQIQSATAEFWAGNARKKQQVQLQAKRVLDRCEQLRRMEDYKDAIKKISTERQCSLERAGIDGDLEQIKREESFANQTILHSPLLEIMGEFLNRRQ